MSYATVYDDKPRTARKAHRCDCCLVEIKPGDKYVSHFSVTDGDPYGAARCLPCSELVSTLFSVVVDPDDGIMFSDLWGDVAALEARAEYRPLALAWYARVGAPVRYVGDERFSFSASGPGSNGLIIAYVEADAGAFALRTLVCEARGTGLDVDELRARFVAATDDALLARLESARTTGDPKPWPEAA